MPTIVSQTKLAPVPSVRASSFKIFRPFWEWLCCYPVLAAEAVIIIGIVWGWLLGNFGAPMLFWHEDRTIQFWAGFSVAALLGKLCLVGYLLEADEPWMQELPPLLSPEEAKNYASFLPGWFQALLSKTPDSLWWYLAVTWPVLLSVTALRAFWPVQAESVFSEAFEHAERIWFLLGLISAPPIAIVVLLTLYAMQGSWLVSLFRRLPNMKSIPIEHLRMHMLASKVFTFLAVVYGVLALTPLQERVPAAVSFCLLLHIVAAAYGVLMYCWPRTIYPILIGLVFFMGIGNFDHHKLSFGTLEAQPLVNLAQFQEAGPCPREQAYLLGQGEIENGSQKDILDRWYENFKQRKPLNQAMMPQVAALAIGQSAPLGQCSLLPLAAPVGALKSPTVHVVACSGGASRAAFWTAYVLTELQRDDTVNLEDIRIITGASGGMLGGAYVAAMAERIRACQQDYVQRDYVIDEMQRRLAQDFLSPVVRQMVFHDLPMAYYPRSIVNDRGRALETAWNKALGPAFDVPMRQLSQGENEAWRPSLVFTPMLVEDGRRLFISNLDLYPLTQTTGPLFGEGKPGLYGISAVELFRLFPENREFKLSTAVRMSATFPYVSPSVTLPTHPPRTVVDAGYYDNFGVNFAAGWLYHHRHWFWNHPEVRVVLLQIRDSVEDDESLTDEAEYKPTNTVTRLFVGGLEHLTTPAQGFLQARESTMTFRNNEQLQMLSAILGEENFSTAVFACNRKVAMTWSLSQVETVAMQLSWHDAELLLQRMEDRGASRKMREMIAERRNRATVNDLSRSQRRAHRNQQQLDNLAVPKPKY